MKLEHLTEAAIKEGISKPLAALQTPVFLITRFRGGLCKQQLTENYVLRTSISIMATLVTTEGCRSQLRTFNMTTIVAHENDIKVATVQSNRPKL
jgi:hypothetical protein